MSDDSLVDVRSDRVAASTRRFNDIGPGATQRIEEARLGTSAAEIDKYPRLPRRRLIRPHVGPGTMDIALQVWRARGGELAKPKPIGRDEDVDVVIGMSEVDSRR